MRSLEVYSPRQLRRVDIELPPLEEGQVVVRVKACAICGSDLRRYREGLQDGGSFGHEFVGIVEQVYGDSGGIEIGDVVTTGLLKSCGTCQPCLSGNPHFCEAVQATYTPGGFSDQCIVTKCDVSRTLEKIPAELPLLRAVLHEPVSCALRIVRRAQAREGDRVAIVGLGAMGVLSGLLLMHQSNGVTITGIDRSENRRTSAELCGFTVAESGNSSSYDIVIDATGDAKAFPFSIDLARLGGTIVLAGVPEGNVHLSPLPIFRKELNIYGAKGPYPYLNDTHRSEALDFLFREDVPWEQLMHVYSFDQSKDAFADADNGMVIKAVITLHGAQK